MRAGLSLISICSLGVTAAFFAPDAKACGGCLTPPGEQDSVVTDHRMVLSVSKTQTTLYDQIEYSGKPTEFAWVLPISGTVDVGLSADSLFTALNQLSAVTVLEPPRNCPPPPVCPSDHDELDSPTAGSGSFQASDASAGAPPIQVLKDETVGPYETVQLKVTDPNDPASRQVLTKWLTDNGFNIPADVQPVIDQYVTEKFNFLALKLKPGADIQSMRPVRVTTQGASSVLPLRMVAAGTGANVGITLWVVSEGRYEPQNFKSFVINDDDLIWDWNTSSSNYKTLRADKSNVDPGKTWEIESSIVINRNQVENLVRYPFSGGGGGAPLPSSGGDYLAITDTSGQETKSAEEVRTEDLSTVFNGIAEGQEHLTRMRSDLTRAALATDLQIIASQDQSLINITRNPKHENGQPQCPVYDNTCRQTGTLPRDQAAAANAKSGDSGTFTCASTPTRLTFGSYGAVGAFLALTIVRAVRKRRRA